MIRNKKLRKFLMLDKRRKRTNFMRIFLKAAAVALAISGLFAYFLHNYIEILTYNTADSEVARTHSNLMQSITEMTNKGTPNAAALVLPPYTYFMVGDPLTLIDSYGYIDQEKNSVALSVLLDKGENEIATSRRRFMASIVFGKSDKEKGVTYPENGWYVCMEEEFDIPELKEFYEKYIHMDQFMTVEKNNKYDIRIDFDLKSAYVNKAEHLFIPHEVTAEYIKTTYQLNAPSVDEIYKTEEFTINADVEGYELVQLHPYDMEKEKVYPVVSLPNFHGTEPDVFDEFWEAVRYEAARNKHSVYSGMSDYKNFPQLENKCNGRIFHITSTYTYNGEEYTLCTVFAVGLWNKHTKHVYAMIVGCFTAFLLFIAFLYSWRKNVMNKADYAFEDYQKALTNNLAHDLKTPLAAIGGYAENLMETASDEKERKYLQSILDNVAYTDSMISKTLELNSGSMKKLNKTKFSLRELTEMVLDKYMIQLEERDVSVNVEGDTEINTDKDMMTSAIENLVSNAVKYTIDSGTIEITIDKDSFIIVNDVSEKTDTRDLTKPFVRGDKNRTGRSGSGLGLSIADNSLSSCGYLLDLDCSDSQFKALIKLKKH